MRTRIGAALGTLAAVSLAAKLAFAYRFDGYLTGDDLEIVQSALRAATGYDYTPWSLRSLFHPVVLVAPILRLAAAIGGLSPGLASFLAALPTILFSTTAIFLVFAVARRMGLDSSVALAAAFLYAFHWLPLAYGATPYPRPISTALFLGALLLATSRLRPLAAAASAGFLVAAACAVRFSETILLVPLLAYSWLESRDTRRLGATVLGFAAGALLLVGVFDAMTWGHAFSSLSEFVRIMFVEAPPPSTSGDKPWFNYGVNVIRWVSPIHLVLMVLALRDRRARVPFLLTLTIVALLSVFRYKQYRYLQAVVPFVAIAAAIGWDRLRPRRAIAVAALGLAAIVGTIQSVRLLREKSQPAVAAARYLSRMSPAPRTVALEQAWAYGERLYLPNSALRDVPPARPLNPAVVRRAVDGADAASFYAKDLDPASFRALAESGMRLDRTFHRDDAKSVTLFRRGTQER